jgi:DNA-binding XRE family transcriptional regulator
MKHYTLDRQAVSASREAAGLSQAHLAAEVGITPSAMSQLESGAKQPSAETAHKIAKALGVQFSDIATAGIRCEHCGYTIGSPGYRVAHETVKAS